MKLFCEPNQVGMYGTKEELEDTEDFYPFVYIPVNII
jgi:V-type H+-transporting ATPase subunit C